MRCGTTTHHAVVAVDCGQLVLVAPSTAPVQGAAAYCAGASFRDWRWESVPCLMTAESGDPLMSELESSQLAARSLTRGSFLSSVPEEGNGKFCPERTREGNLLSDIAISFVPSYSVVICGLSRWPDLSWQRPTRSGHEEQLIARCSLPHNIGCCAAEIRHSLGHGIGNPRACKSTSVRGSPTYRLCASWPRSCCLLEIRLE